MANYVMKKEKCGDITVGQANFIIVRNFKFEKLFNR
jgi:hypothetical protein